MILTRRRKIFYSLSFYSFILNSSGTKNKQYNPKLIGKLNSILDCFPRECDMHMKQINNYLSFWHAVF